MTTSTTIASARGLLDALAGIEAGPALDTLAARRLAAMDSGEAAVVLADLLVKAIEEPRDRKVLAAVCRALQGTPPGLSFEQRRALRMAASSLQLGPVTALLSEAQPERALDAEARSPDARGGPQTLGHRTHDARRATDPDRIARFALDEDPSVIRNLLLNPRLTEPMVVRIAARRPAPAAVLSEIARSRRWGRQINVRRAIVHNPYASPALVNPLLPQLDEVDLRGVADDPVIHPAVRAAARAILGARAS